MSKHVSMEIDEHNSRIKLMKYPKTSLEALVKHLEELADQKELGKVMIYADPDDLDTFQELGFEHEGEISGFFDGEPAMILSRFIDENRAVSKDEEKKDRIVELAERKLEIEEPPQLDPAFTLRQATLSDVEELADLYNQVFETYPTPMHDPSFVREYMENDVYFSVITYQGKIISAASADVFTKYNCAEITDCATKPEFRGKGLLSVIIYDLEKKMKEQEIYNLFSLTRAVSTGMNIVISKLGFEYQGRLIQNSHIAGQFEDMNIWVKQIG
ncbi:putative beta-lysine N-acetyltransferase [Hazenella coriacea]|nr:putative beta-lysine N-acetyltransferase [Hazenella coriacea]